MRKSCRASSTASLADALWERVKVMLHSRRAPRAPWAEEVGTDWTERAVELRGMSPATTSSRTWTAACNGRAPAKPHS